MGRIARSWELVKQSFRILRSDKELMLLPITSAISCVVVSVVILSGGALAFLPEIKASLATNAHWQPNGPGMWACLFVFYLANYFIIVFFNVALVSAASSRLAGGQATIDDGLQAAWERKGRIFQWALLAATVGILLRMMEERMSSIGRLVARLIGVAWTLASYFVVPVLAAEDLGPVQALKRSAQVFRETWGEKVVGGFSFGLIFMLLALPGMAFPLLGAAVGPAGMIVGSSLMVLYWLLLGVVSAATEGIFTAALYRYATTKQVSAGFRPENFSMAWQPKQ
ncbi:MAG TPA: DUF6159 family protein [Candidatus Acidoferrales bacterium]|nr:DUF6159 family protein [Candidatus Acidoferrales bacterium]